MLKTGKKWRTFVSRIRIRISILKWDRIRNTDMEGPLHGHFISEFNISVLFMSHSKDISNTFFIKIV